MTQMYDARLSKSTHRHKCTTTTKVRLKCGRFNWYTTTEALQTSPCKGWQGDVTWFLANTLTKNKQTKNPTHKTLEIMVINKGERVRKKLATSICRQACRRRRRARLSPFPNTGNLDGSQSPETRPKADLSGAHCFLSVSTKSPGWES